MRMATFVGTLYAMIVMRAAEQCLLVTDRWLIAHQPSLVLLRGEGSSRCYDRIVDFYENGIL